MENEMDIQKWRGKLLFQLIEDCKATGVWDGYVRNGFVSPQERVHMAEYSDKPEVQDQLVLQNRAGVPVGRKTLEAL